MVPAPKAGVMSVLLGALLGILLAIMFLRLLAGMRWPDIPGHCRRCKGIGIERSGCETPGRGCPYYEMYWRANGDQPRE